MTHLPYIAASYGLFIVTAAFFSISAMLRLSQAGRRLRAVDVRGRR